MSIFQFPFTCLETCCKERIVYCQNSSHLKFAHLSLFIWISSAANLSFIKVFAKEFKVNFPIISLRLQCIHQIDCRNIRLRKMQKIGINKNIMAFLTGGAQKYPNLIWLIYFETQKYPQHSNNFCMVKLRMRFYYKVIMPDDHKNVYCVLYCEDQGF